jgi:hypothetical protein
MPPEGDRPPHASENSGDEPGASVGRSKRATRWPTGWCSPRSLGHTATEAPTEGTRPSGASSSEPQSQRNFPVGEKGGVIARSGLAVGVRQIARTVLG